MKSGNALAVEVSRLRKSYYVRVTCRAVHTSRSDYEASLDVIARELFNLKDGAGAEFSSDPAEMEIHFGFVISCNDLNEAGATASGIARTALHAAGGATPNWGGSYEIVESSQKQLQAA
jgi:hypothetical protein